ncbi:EAL domain-containing protein [Pseudoalteromonas sp. H105]|uniref:sensor domain-containing phosphodiesterase n=1 Tax=Pseudoalteromonas sp. H105 TaxID=1348393 RepID=UPI000731F536|nr:EAL domain-containing protein [Pseudoalteromonas sp. H105]KTF17943.1 diguanylate phosphodiesterase [Pseudoalteromonas sp. H105]
MQDKQLLKLLKQQQKILSKIALGQPLSEISEEICLAIEEMLEDESAKCSILSLKGNQLFHCAAPSIDAQYCQIINGVEIGPNVGSCGTAAFSETRIIVDDINTSPLWKDFKQTALNFGLASCWSTPIISTKSTVLGTFAVYHTSPKSPTEQDLELIDYFVNFTSIALENDANASELNEVISQLKHSNEKFEAFTQVMPDLVLILGEQGEYVDVYGSSDDFLYASLAQTKGKSINDFLAPKDSQPIMTILEKTLSSNEIQVFEYELDVPKGRIVFEGRTVPVEHYQSKNSYSRHVLWVARDITQRKQAEKAIEKLAYYDPLTKLPNRRMLNERLDMTVEKIKRSGETGALLFLDIDDFKRLNDSLGHSSGDELLVEVARRLGTVIRKSDTLARLGGDEFVVLLEYLGDDNEKANLESAIVAQKIHKTFDEEFKVGALKFQVSCSIGICLIEGTNVSASNILKFADTAMYRSKAKGGNSYSFYDPQLQTLLDRKIELETEILKAIENQEFCAYFQPQINNEGKVVGAEALIRWVHPVKGIIAPGEFIPVAEQFGLIQRLQNIVLNDICNLLKRLNPCVIDDDFKVSINISPSQFKSSLLKSALLNILHSHHVSPSKITLEITESMLAHDVEHTVQQMEELKSEGFTFSIDDFGTGYSCLAYLHAYPVKQLKIDKSFIDRISNKESGFSIVKTIIDLANNLGMGVVAEGVETKEQFTILKHCNIDSIQGYYFAKPMPMNDYLNNHSKNFKRD